MNALSRFVALWKRELLLIKATSFALVGVINVAVNFTIFWLGLHLIKAVPALAQGLKWTAETCRCVSSENAEVIAANVVAWCVAVTGSYVMNSMTTFAAESGRKLTWRAYFTFAASGLLGLLADTTVLLIAKSFLPIMLAKLLAIGAAFVVNFSMSHFVVFRKKNPTVIAREGGRSSTPGDH
jgi:putative flippase GtrA